MKHILKNDTNAYIACFETEDGRMNLQIDSTSVQMTKERFISFSMMVNSLGRLLIDEMIDERLSKHGVLTFDA